jgi:hypothetical protein
MHANNVIRVDFRRKTPITQVPPAPHSRYPRECGIISLWSATMTWMLGWWLFLPWFTVWFTPIGVGGS